MGQWQWHVVGCYIIPSDASIIENVDAAIRVGPHGAKLLVAGNLTAKLADLEGTLQSEAIADDLAAAVLMKIFLRGIKGTWWLWIRRSRWVVSSCRMGHC